MASAQDTNACAYYDYIMSADYRPVIIRIIIVSMDGQQNLCCLALR